jgi:hypothetical protein
VSGAAERWWFDLKQGRAVTDEERGPGKDVLGPYPTREAAEHWHDSHERREEAWEEDDERWEGEPGDEAAPPA